MDQFAKNPANDNILRKKNYFWNHETSPQKLTITFEKIAGNEICCR